MTHIRKLLIVSLAISFAAMGILFTTGGKHNAQSLYAAKISNTIEQKIYDDLITAYPKATGRKIDQIKELRDFADNIYYVVEFLPVGYSIYDQTFNESMEIAADGISPYLNRTENLIYGGATYYYVKSTDAKNPSVAKYSHTKLGEELIVNATQRSAYVDYSNKMAKNVQSAIDERKQNATRGSWQEVVELPNRNIITGCNTYGFNYDWSPSPGNCGYVAAALVVWYAKMQWGVNCFAPNGFNYSLVSSIQNGNDPGSDYVMIRDAINNYRDRRDPNHNSTVSAHYWFNPNDWEVFRYIGEGKPTILFSTMADAPHHAITLHKAERTCKQVLFVKTYWDYKLTVHYGYDTDQNNITISYHAGGIRGVTYLKP